MKEKHNIDEFFANRLDKSNAEEADWNTPSDLVWENASVHFVDRKKKKRRAIFWWLGSAILLIGVGFLVNYGLSKKTIQLKSLQSTQKITTETTSELIPKSTPELEKQVPKTYEDPSILNTTKSNLKASTQEETNNTIADSQLSTASNFAEIKNEIQKNRVQSISKSQANLDNTKQRKSIIESKNSNITNSLNDKEILEVKNKNMSISTSGIGLNLIDVDPDKSKRGLLGIVPSLDSYTSLLSHNEAVSIAPKFTSPLLNKTFPKYEFGVLTTRYVINVLSLQDEFIAENNDEFKINFDFTNFGVRGTKWLNEKWSFSADLKYSKGDLNISFCIADTLQSDINTHLNDSGNGISSRNEINALFEDSSVELKDNIILNKGDLIKITGNLNMKAKMIQLPIFLDYHIYKKKWEFTFGAGVGLGYTWFDAGIYDVRVHKDDLLISKNVFTEQISDKEFFGEALGGVGIKYHLNKNWNLGTNFRVSTTDLLLSSADIGLYYRL